MTTTYVLVHGAGAGGWQWDAVARLLRMAGHDVYTPSLTGAGTRAHLLGPEVDLAAHIDDVCRVMQQADLSRVVLVGKSYAGLVISGVAERAASRLAQVVYLDALVPRDGESFLDLAGEQIAARMRTVVSGDGAGWRLPVDRTAEERMNDIPFASLSQPLRLASPEAARLPRTYILCTRKKANHHTRLTAIAAERARDAGWAYFELDADHEPERHHPDAVARLLLALAPEGPLDCRL